MKVSESTIQASRCLLTRLVSFVCSWNFTPSPGWTKEEAQILKLCLMKYGVGRWVQILDTGLLPGKLIQQLNGQTQRLIGQQSLAGMASCLGTLSDLQLGYATTQASVACSLHRLAG